MVNRDTSEFCKKLAAVCRIRQQAAKDDHQRKVRRLCKLLRGKQRKEPDHD